ncbi:hypothetical protein PybrP1_007569, partial [[Pythium] brassicae (nom. inval.)]
MKPDFIEFNNLIPLIPISNCITPVPISNCITPVPIPKIRYIQGSLKIPQKLTGFTMAKASSRTRLMLQEKATIRQHHRDNPIATRKELREWATTKFSLRHPLAKSTFSDAVNVMEADPSLPQHAKHATVRGSRCSRARSHPGRRTVRSSSSQSSPVLQSSKRRREFGASCYRRWTATLPPGSQIFARVTAGLLAFKNATGFAQSARTERGGGSCH